MKLITITQPAFFEGEAEAITSLFDAGLEILHLRKPGASYEDMEQLLNRLPPEYLKRIVTHEHFQLASFRNLKGIHLNGRNPAAPAGFTGHVSRSCHSLEEVAKYKATCDYVFLSPIYDSISKEGYPSAYTTDSLQKARQAGIIDAKVMALLRGFGYYLRKKDGEIHPRDCRRFCRRQRKRTGTDFIGHFKELLRAASLF